MTGVPLGGQKKQKKNARRPEEDGGQKWLEAWVPGAAVAKKRPRFSTKSVAYAKVAKVYTEKSVVAYENWVAWHMRLALSTYAPAGDRDICFRVPVECEIVVYVKRPSRPKHREPGTRPDLDNLVKSCFDGVNRAGNVWADDSLVVRLVASKVYAADAASVGVSVKVRPAGRAG